MSSHLGTVRFHDIDVIVRSATEVIKRKRYGRPRIGEEAPTRTVWPDERVRATYRLALIIRNFIEATVREATVRKAAVREAAVREATVREALADNEETPCLRRENASPRTR